MFDEEHTLEMTHDTDGNSSSGPTPTRLGCFVLTHKRPDDLHATLTALLGQTRRADTLAVIDNADDPATREVVAKFADDGVRYHATGANLGSAGGVAYGFRTLMPDDVDWILSVDDDDPPHTNDTLERMVALIDRHRDNDTTERVGIIGTFGAAWNWDTGEHARVLDSELVGDVDVDVIGGNGFLTVSREVLETVGPPNERFFFGHYDPLYCLEVKQAGYRVLVDGSLMLDCRADDGRLGIDALPRSIVPSHPYHSLWRRYYVTRNYIHAMRTTFDRPDLARRHAFRMLARTGPALRRGPRYGWRYLTMQTRGVIDGYRSRLGPTVSPVAKPTQRAAPPTSAVTS